MALRLLNLQTICERNLIRQIPLLTTTRFGHRLRGKAPGVAKTLEQRLSGKLLLCTHLVVMLLCDVNNRLPAEKDVDPEIEEQVDIGFPQPKTGSKADQRKERITLMKEQRKAADLEKLARTQTRNLKPFAESISVILLKNFICSSR